jgi:inhibitor of KinA
MAEGGQQMNIVPFGDRAVRVTFGDRIDPAIQAEITRFMHVLDRRPFPGFSEYVPAYTNLAVYYDPLVVLKKSGGGRITAQARVTAFLSRLYDECKNEGGDSGKRHVVHIPVCYGGKYGPDLEKVATYHHLRTAEVINKHSQPQYLVYMLGFAPGFPFLGGLPEELATPRRAEPRLKIPAGSVGIAGKQTGAYPLESPGGWQLIGRTPLSLFIPQKDPPTLLTAGDLVSFDPISEDTFRSIKEGAPWRSH